MERCFLDGEVERLVHYLKYTKDSEDDEDSRWVRIALEGKPWGGDEEEKIEPPVEEVKKAKRYEGESSFGNSRVAISENARAHLLDCARCRKAYIGYIRGSSQRIASRMSEFMERQGQGIHGAGIFGNYYNWLIHFDALELFDREELAEKMMDLVKMTD